MRLVLLTILALVAFAANSVLTKYALAKGQIGPEAFIAIRLVAGAVMLVALVAFRGGISRLSRFRNPMSALALLAYAVTFSYAYLTLQTGIGALILFGGVQITMFAGAIIGGERPNVLRWAGTIIGMAGLAVLFAPGATVPDPFGAVLMSVAAISWGIYSLRGKSISEPLLSTSANFLLAAVAGILLWLVVPSAIPTTGQGAALAVASGALASGLGYAIWYAVLPKLDRSLAAILQLSVPIIALSGGILFLGEALSWRFAIATLLISGGVLMAILSKTPAVDAK